MNALRIRTIIDKEWAEVFKNRLVLFTVAFLPILFTVLPLGVLYGTRSSGSTAASDLPPQFLSLCGNLPAGECMQYFILNEFLILFMILPLIIPISIAPTASWAKRPLTASSRCWPPPSAQWSCWWPKP